MARRSGLSGVSRLRRTLRRIPETITADVKKQVLAAAQLVDRQQDAAAPSRSISENTTVKTARDGLTATVGLHGKRAARRGFLARIFEFGAKPHIIVPRADKPRNRRRKVGGAKFLANIGTGQFFGKIVRHKGMRARPFFFGTFRKLKPEILRRIKAAIGEAVRKASNG